MSWDFFSTREVKASRKERRCEECGGVIDVGAPYTSCNGKFEGDFTGYDTHPECISWASAVLDSDFGEARPFLCDADPLDEEDPVAAVRKHPVSDVLYARLPARWQAVVDAARQVV